LRHLQLVAIVLTIIVASVEGLHLVLQTRRERAERSPRAVVVDGDFVVHMHEFARARHWRGLVRARPEGRLWMLSVVVVNRGKVAAAARPRFTLVAGDYRFPAVACRGRAFTYQILPDGSSRGVVAFDLAANLVPETIEIDVDGNGSPTAAGIGPMSKPP
jgi:hypothetical protein